MGAATRKILTAVQPTVKQGMVKWFRDEKSFGFIKQDDGGPDLFFHREDITTINQGVLPSVHDGCRVSYIEVPERRGPRAKQVTKL